MSEAAAPRFWQVRFAIAADCVDEILAAMDDGIDSLAVYEAEDGAWTCEVLTRDRQAIDGLRSSLATVLGSEAPASDTLEVEELGPKDWLEATRRSFPARRIARFWVHGSHVDTPPPADSVPLLIDAGTAFGSGEHGSTIGCLRAIDTLARRCRFRRVLDMGCGSAILAIAALKCWPAARAAAIDVDPGSVATARDNAERNGVAARLTAAVGDGYMDLRRAGRFDLVVANILAGPLMDMAPELARCLGPGGHAVLAGLLAPQAEAVMLAHRRQGLRLMARVLVGPWATLILVKPRGPVRRRNRRYPNPFEVEQWPMPWSGSASVERSEA